MSIAGVIRRVSKQHAQSGLEIGEEVAKAHAMLAGDGRDGQFSQWVNSECGFSLRTAYNYMNAWQTFGASETIEQYEPTAMYTLAGAKVPPAAVKEAEKLAKKGERITADKADEILSKFRAVTKKTSAKQANGTTSVQPLHTSLESQPSVSGSNQPSDEAPPDLPPVATVKRTEAGSQDSGDAGECPRGGKHERNEDGDCVKCFDPPVEPVKRKVSGGPTFDTAELSPSEVKDGFGDEVTGELRHVFEICEEFKEKRQQLTNLKTWITQRLAHPGCALLVDAESRIKSDIDNLDSELRFATPHCACVYCNAKMPKLANCSACKGRGWISLQVYKQAPKDLKRA